MKKQIFVSTFALLVACLAPLAATAEQVTFQANMPFTLVPDQFTLDLPKFDTSLGVLEGIEICVTASGSIEAEVDNLEPTGGTAEGEISGLVEIDSPAMQGIGFVLGGSNTFPADFMGSVSVDVDGTQTFAINPSDFGFFLAGSPGEQFSSLVDIETAEVFGDPAIMPDFQTGVVDSGVLKVTYTYSVPEPSSAMLLLVIGLGWTNCSRSRKSQAKR